MGITYTNYSKNTFFGSIGLSRGGARIILIRRKRFIQLMKNKSFGGYEYTFVLVFINAYLKTILGEEKFYFDCKVKEKKIKIC